MNGEDLCEEFYANTLIPEILQNRGGGYRPNFPALAPGPPPPRQTRRKVISRSVRYHVKVAKLYPVFQSLPLGAVEGCPLW